MLLAGLGFPFMPAERPLAPCPGQRRHRRPDGESGESWGQAISGVVVGAVAAVSVRDFVRNLFQQNWQADWQAHGVLVGALDGALLTAGFVLAAMHGPGRSSHHRRKS